MSTTRLCKTLKKVSLINCTLFMSKIWAKGKRLQVRRIIDVIDKTKSRRKIKYHEFYIFVYSSVASYLIFQRRVKIYFSSFSIARFKCFSFINSFFVRSVELSFATSKDGLQDLFLNLSFEWVGLIGFISTSSTYSNAL